MIMRFSRRLSAFGVLLLLWLLLSWWVYTRIEDYRTSPKNRKNVNVVEKKRRLGKDEWIRSEAVTQYFTVAKLENVTNDIKFEENERNANQVNTLFLRNTSLLTITNYEIESKSKDKLKARNFIDDIDLLYLDEAEKRNINYIWYDTDIETVMFCVGVNTRLGNIMHEYFLAQSIAFFMQKKFKFVDPLHYQRYNCSLTNLKRNLQYFFKYADYQNNPRLWQQFSDSETDKAKMESVKSINAKDILYSHYLPKDMDFRINAVTSNKIKLFVFNIIDYINRQPNVYDRRKPYRSVLRLLYFNPLFYHEVVGKLIIDSLDKYYSEHAMEKDRPFFVENNDKNDKIGIFHKNIDYSIHFRCGDIVVGKYPYHGLLTLKYFERIFSALEMSDAVKVYFFTQLSANTIRGAGEEKGFEKTAEFKCNFIVEKYAKYLRKLIYPSQLVIIGAGNINDDLYKMSHSKVLICSASTFCEIAAFANEKGMVILPSNGPWKDWYFDFRIWNGPSNHKFVNLQQENSLILSGLQMYGWNASKIVDYLITH